MATEQCIYHLNRIFDGPLSTERVNQHRCRNGRRIHVTDQFKAHITWRFGAATGCDETKAFLPGGLVLLADGNVISRDDHFAYFKGSFKLARLVKGKVDKVYFSGSQFELVFNTGSHQALKEACDEREHAEGWLVGRGEGMVLSAAIVGHWSPNHTDDPYLRGGAVFANASVNRITGVLVKES